MIEGKEERGIELSRKRDVSKIITFVKVDSEEEFNSLMNWLISTFWQIRDRADPIVVRR